MANSVALKKQFRKLAGMYGLRCEFTEFGGLPLTIKFYEDKKLIHQDNLASAADFLAFLARMEKAKFAVWKREILGVKHGKD